MTTLILMSLILIIVWTIALYKPKGQSNKQEDEIIKAIRILREAKNKLNKTIAYNDYMAYHKAEQHLAKAYANYLDKNKQINK